MTPLAFQPLSSDAALGESLVLLGLLGIGFYSLQLNKFIYVQILKHLTSTLYIEPSPYNKPPCFTKTADHADVRETAGQQHITKHRQDEVGEVGRRESMVLSGTTAPKETRHASGS